MNTKPKILLIEDDASTATSLQKVLCAEGYEVAVSTRGDAGLEQAQQKEYDVVVTDLKMPGLGGLDLVAQLHAAKPKQPIILMTAHGTTETAIEATKLGACDYLLKPFEADELLDMVASAVASSRLMSEPVQMGEATTGRSAIIGNSRAMQSIYKEIGRVAATPATVLIRGATGTGKELIARAIYQHSQRPDKPFIAVNCAAIPDALLESELFGHERGAFTGAQAMRRGRFEQAEGGTLFLDEIGDMPAELQTRLLRVLSDGFFYRVGGHQPLKADARVIAATHQNLDEQVREGRFREDLFHRLNVIRLRLPPLRERREDIPLLARHFLARSAKELGVESKRLSEDALQFVSQLQLPGNVRQLENLCHWLTVLAPAQLVRVEDFPPELRQEQGLLPTAVSGEAPARATAGAVGGAQALSDWRALLRVEVRRRLEAGESGIIDALTNDFESVVIGGALSHVRGRRMEAAERLGLGRNTITRKIRELRLDHADD